MLTIAVDFDGTIVQHKFPWIGKPVPGAFEWLKKWREAGAKLILWTMRDDERESGDPEYLNTLSRAVEFCRQNGVEFDGHNKNRDQESWSKSPKAYAHIYVDDAAFGCPLVHPSGVDGLADLARPFVDWSIVGPAVMKALRPDT